MTFAAIAKIGAIDPNRPTGEHEHDYDHEQEEKQKYTCPMHPEVITDHPGNCPKCGMKLVPLKEKKRGTSNSDKSRAGVQRSTSEVGAMESPAVASQPLRDLNRPIAASATPRLMKQILLRVPAVFAEIGFGELAKPLRAHLPSTRKIMLPQHALDPDIDRECSQPLIRKKHHAICNLRPHAWQRA